MTLKNPFFLYVLSFGSVLLIYQLQWSEIYPAITLDTILIFALTFVVAGSLALALSGGVKAVQRYRPGRLPKYTWVIVLACLAADIIDHGSIPLVDLIRGQFVYGSFVGIKSLHVFTVTFGGAFATIRYADFLYAKGRSRWAYLLQAMIVVAYYVLVVYRGPAIITAVSCFFVYVIKNNGIGFKRGVAFTALALAALYGNGIIGEMRSPGAVITAQPSQAFKDSGIPTSYYWTYLYITVPFANFQKSVSETDNQHYESVGNVADFVIGEMLPDFVSKRFFGLTNSTRIDTPEVAPGFNVATGYGRSYAYLGWIGVLLMFVVLMVYSLIYLTLISGSTFMVPGLALLNTMMVFFIFDNMIAFSGMLLQLGWLLLLDRLPDSTASHAYHSPPATVPSVSIGRSIINNWYPITVIATVSCCLVGLGITGHFLFKAFVSL